MTYPEFLEKLKQTPRDWYLNESGGIRRKGEGLQCPLSSLTPTTLDYFVEAGLKLGLERSLVFKIATVADRYENEENYDSQIRKDLLEACGL